MILNNQAKKRFILVLIFLIVVAVAYLFSVNIRSTKFVGNITELDTRCHNDGQCRVKVDDVWIITELGGDPSPNMVKKRGSRGLVYFADGSSKTNISQGEAIGKKVEVYAKRINKNILTLYGSKKYYIKFLER